MDALIEWGYSVILALQGFRSPALDLLFEGLTRLGNEEFYLVLIPLLYWVVDKRLATRVAVLFLLSTYLNSLAKALANQPRPSPERVAVLDDPGEGGLPSGHAQNSLVLWGLLGSQPQGQRFRLLLVALVLAIGLSRVYLGVHFPHDVLAGWLIGALLLLLYGLLAPRVEQALARQPLALQMAAGASVPLLLALLFRSDNALTAMGTLCGLALGVPLERARVAFAMPWHAWWQVGGRILLGLLVLLLLRFGLKPLLLPLGDLGLFLRYTVIGSWVAVGAPWAFVRGGLAAQEESR